MSIEDAVGGITHESITLEVMEGAHYVISLPLINGKRNLCYSPRNAKQN